MNKLMLATLPLLFSAFSFKAIAQDEPARQNGKKQTEEIIIRKSGDKAENVTIQINGDEVLINGKPMMEFKDDDITVNKRKIIIREGGRSGRGDMGFERDMPGGLNWQEGRKEKRTFLGVSTEKSEDGARIDMVTENSGAAKAGLEKGDVITKVNGRKVDGPQVLAEIISAMKPGEEVKINYKRGSKNKSVKATLGEREDASAMRSFSFNGPDGSFKTFTIPSMPGNGEWKEMLGEGFPFGQEGFEGKMEGLDGRLKDLDIKLNAFPRKQKLGIRIQDTEESAGVKVLDVEDSSAAARAGLMKDDIITEIAGVKVTNTDDAREQLMENSEKTSYSVKARRNGSEMNFQIKIPKKLKTANL